MNNPNYRQLEDYDSLRLINIRKLPNLINRIPNNCILTILHSKHKIVTFKPCQTVIVIFIFNGYGVTKLNFLKIGLRLYIYIECLKLGGNFVL